MQLIVTTILLGTIHLTAGGFLDWFRGNQDQNQVHRVGPINIEVLLPKGIRLWTHYNPDLTLFGVELYVKYFEGQTEALECALCQNTSVPVYGKFLLQDDDLVARAGDVLEYVIITSDGETDMRHTTRRTVVDDNLIRSGDQQCDCTVLQNPDALLEPATEVELLERMIHRVIANRSRSCESLSKWLVLRVEPRNELADVEEHVHTVVHRMLRVAVLLDRDGASLAISDPTELIDRVEDHPDGIAFRVRSVMEKLKLLELLRSSRLVVDYDGIFSRALNNDEHEE
ncbi:hypothetical protein AND_007616 [Anopheles darlingi]|uniref:CBM39 domain-containing protein n=1 Tax=Anopheles darlingi TaxID=43151 RepID=W5JBG9_ANODA|nr:hypothetical protein AND_007616 [Anopheles darlingi]